MVDLASLLITGIGGVVISALLSPLFSEKVIRTYSRLGLFRPEFSLSASVTKSFYEEGEPVDKFDGIEWKPSHEVLRLGVKNKADTPIHNIRLSVFFPGFINAITVSNSGGREVDLGSPHEEIEMFNHQDENVVQSCSLRPNISQIDEYGEVVFEFLIDTNPSSGGAYAFWNPTKDIKGSLNWEARGVRLSGQFAERIRDDIGIYDEPDEPDGLILKMDEYPFPDRNPDITLGVLDDPAENPLYEKYKDKIEKE